MTPRAALQGAMRARQVSSYFNRLNTPWNPVRNGAAGAMCLSTSRQRVADPSAAANALSSQGVVIVPQQTAWVVETFGRFDKVLQPGLRFLIPFVQRVSYVFSLKEEAISVPSQVTPLDVALPADRVSETPLPHPSGCVSETPFSHPFADRHHPRQRQRRHRRGSLCQGMDRARAAAARTARQDGQLAPVYCSLLCWGYAFLGP